ncbi:MAG TPA: YciI family protein [Streptosporangiaceae bacterium]|nr:YciI family protein [Streptosporangiaceae bacterium]
MKFFGYTLGDPNTPSGPESPEMYARMSEFVAEATKAGILLATGGLAPVDEAIKVSYTDGKYTVLDGPFAEAKELVGGWALMECRDKDEAVEWVKRFLGVVGHGESTIREVYGP